MRLEDISVTHYADTKHTDAIVTAPRHKQTPVTIEVDHERGIIYVHAAGVTLFRMYPIACVILEQTGQE